MQKKKIFFYPFAASSEAQPHLPHVTPMVPRSVHAKFHAVWTKTVGATGIHTDRQTNKQTNFNKNFCGRVVERCLYWEGMIKGRDSTFMLRINANECACVIVYKSNNAIHLCIIVTFNLRP